MNENKEDCPNCLGTGEEFNRRRKKGKSCHICKGEGTVDEIIADAYLHQEIPNLNII